MFTYSLFLSAFAAGQHSMSNSTVNDLNMISSMTNSTASNSTTSNSTLNDPDVISYKSNSSIKDVSLKNNFTFTPSKAGIVYFETPLGLKLSQCAVTVKESDIGKPVTLGIGGVPIFDNTTSASAVIKSLFYEKDACTSHNSSISINRTVGKATICKSTGDPHFKTSFGSKFSLQDEGYFTLFNSKHLTVQVFQKKFGTVSVNQAVAIRYGDEVYILDVRSRNATDTLSEANDSRQNFVVYTPPTADRPTHHLRFSPCSSVITIKASTWLHGRYLDVTVNAAAFYSHSGITGICGAKTAPKNLTSFTVPDNGNYFQNGFKNLTELSNYKRLVNCVIPTATDACNPPSTSTTAVTSILSTSSAVLPNLSSDSSSTGSVTSSPSATLPAYVSPTSSAVLPELSSGTSSSAPTPTSIPPNYNETVQTLCTNVMVAIKCGNLVDVDFYTQACISDCHGTGSLAPIEATKLQMSIDCKSQTELQSCHPDPIKAQAAVTIQISLGISNNTCPNSCSNNGQCVSTGCVCNAGYTGLGCETNLKEIAAPISEFYAPITYPTFAPVYGASQILGEALPSAPAVQAPAVQAPATSVGDTPYFAPNIAVALDGTNNPATEAIAPGLDTSSGTNNFNPDPVVNPGSVDPSLGPSATNNSIYDPIPTPQTDPVPPGGDPVAPFPPSQEVISHASPIATTSTTLVSMMLLLVNFF